MKVKICYKCKQEKNIDQFYTSGKTAAGYTKYSSRCKDCDNSRSISAKRLATRLAYRKAKKFNMRDALNQLKQTMSCNKCGMSFREQPWLLDFHHRDPNTKSFQIGSGPTFLKPWEVIMEEVGKCDPLCANCHRTLHYLETHPL